MPVKAIDIVTRLTPAAKPAYVQAFRDHNDLIVDAGITTPLRLAHFMAQALHETGGLDVLEEFGGYTAKNLGDMWDSGNWRDYFPSRQKCVAMAAQCAVDKGQALFNLVYGGRMGNGAAASGDGWRYRGRGIMQTTGRDSYRHFAGDWNVPFEAQPELVISGAHALKPAISEWKAKSLGVLANHNKLEAISYDLNGGYIGIDGRKAWFKKIWPIAAGDPQNDVTAWKVQSALIVAGYDASNPDGKPGARTKRAILNYRADKRLTPGDAIDAELLTSLGI